VEGSSEHDNERSSSIKGTRVDLKMAKQSLKCVALLIN
jgi:hypothetical protein